jgi:hypothetical protein
MKREALDQSVKTIGQVAKWRKKRERDVAGALQGVTKGR